MSASLTSGRKRGMPVENGCVLASHSCSTGPCGTGVVVHLASLWLFTSAIGANFVVSQIAATLIAMTWNFFLNNNLTYADRKLHGFKLITGLIGFCGICALGGIANISVANAIYQANHQTFIAGLSGAIMSSVFNYAVTRAFTWK